MNKPKIKDSIIYSHPIIGDVSLNDIIQNLKSLTKVTKEFETISMNLLKSYNIDKDTFISLFTLLTASSLESLLDDLECNIE